MVIKIKKEQTKKQKSQDDRQQLIVGLMYKDPLFVVSNEATMLEQDHV